jgi:predicted esterase
MTRPRPIRTATERSIVVPRTARYYVIGDDSDAIDELWIVLHGFGQLAGVFIEYFVDLADGRRVVAAPEALNRYYTNPSTAVPASERPVGATWMTREDRENEIADYVRYLDHLHAELSAKHHPARTIVVGFSQGGATAARWAVLGKTPIDRVILWGATLPPEVDVARANELLRGARLTFVIGQRDQYISAHALEAERSRLDAAAVRYDLVEYDAGHSIKRAVLLDVAGVPSTG